MSLSRTHTHTHTRTLKSRPIVRLDAPSRQANPGNLLGTIRGQDGQAATDLNCTNNKGVQDNGEFNHCEWGLVSRDGWVVYDDSDNAFTDGKRYSLH